MILTSRSAFAKQVSGRSPVSWYKIPGNLLRCNCDIIPYLDANKVFISQKSGKPTDGSDKDPPNKFTSQPPDSNKKGLLSSVKYAKDLSKKAVDLYKASVTASKFIPEELRLSLLKASKSDDRGKVDPSSGSPQKYGVDFRRKIENLIEPLVSEKPYSAPRTINTVAPKKSDLPNNRIPVTQDSSGQSSPASQLPAKRILDSSGYLYKDSSENWTPLVRYGPVSKSDSASGQNQRGGYMEERPLDNWTSNTQFSSYTAKSGVGSGQETQPAWAPPQQFTLTTADTQGNWIPTPQYFAADFSQRQGDHRGNYDQQLPSNWTTQYHADPDQPAGGSGGSQSPSKKTDSDDPCDKKSVFNPSKPSMYSVRKYGPELPSNASVLEFEAVGNLPTGIFRCHSGECLGPGAQKGGIYQNPEYFAFHNMTYYDMHCLLREFRRPSPDTKRKL